MSFSIASALISAAEIGLLPDVFIRYGIRRLCRRRLADEARLVDAPSRAAFRAGLASGPVALVPEKANEQHYEVPTSLFRLMLGRHLKYSSCFYPPGVTALDDAEDAALRATVERARLADGQDILELGCGWGSLTLFMAEAFPAARITAVSNSAVQRTHIEAELARRGLGNVRVLTRDMNDFEPEGSFDRVVSVEMFEHLRNYAEMFRRVTRWLRPGGGLFLHVFCHRTLVYPFEDEGQSDWMARHFFSGGIMPSATLLPRFATGLHQVESWTWDGTHYQRTAEAWLRNLDAHREAALATLAETYGRGAARRWFGRWRMFFLACAELFGYRGGSEWMVVHHWFRKPGEVFSSSPSGTTSPTS